MRGGGGCRLFIALYPIPEDIEVNPMLTVFVGIGLAGWVILFRFGCTTGGGRLLRARPGFEASTASNGIPSKPE